MVHLGRGGVVGGLTGVAAALALGAGALADEVKLVDGDVLTGRVVEQTSSMIVLEHALAGRIEIPRDQIASLETTSGLSDGETPSEPTPLQDDDEDPTPAADDMPKEWDFSLSLSATGSWGNTDEQSARLGFTANRTREKTRVALDASYYGGLTDGDTSDNNATIGATYDWLMPASEWFWFVSGRYDFDQFESWDHRVSGQTGPGYRLIKSSKFDLDVRGGAGPRREWGSDDDSWLLEAVVGTEFTWRITERQKLSGRATAFTVVDDQENYRSRSSLDWTLKLDPELNLSLTAGLRHEYQNFVDPGDDRNNTKAFIGLKVDW